MYRCCGITGLVAAAHAREVMLSDYTPEVINTNTNTGVHTHIIWNNHRDHDGSNG
jgi:hypothetical protein